MKHLIHLLFLLISLAASAAEFQPDVGVIAAENKPVDIKSTTLDGNVVHRMVAIGQPVYLNDEINTGPDNKVQVLLKDKTAFNLGSNATIIVGKFVLNIEKPELSVDIKKGVFRFVSGRIADMKKDSMKVAVPNAVIGIRGTSVAGAINPDGSSTVVLIHGAIGIQGSQNSVEITKSGYGSQITSGGLINPPVAIPASTIKAITNSVASNQSNSGLSAAELSNSLDASSFVSAATAQAFKASLMKSIEAQMPLNGNQNLLTAQILNDAIRNNPDVWSGILQAFGMPANTPIPDSQKQASLSQFIDSDFAQYYALLVFPKIYTPLELQTGAMGPLGLVTFNAANIPMSCTTFGVCGANATATINSQTVTLNYSQMQMTNTFNVSYANFYGLTGSLSGRASLAFSALQPPSGGGIGPQLNVILPGDGASASDGASLAMVGQFGSIGSLTGKWATLTSSLGVATPGSSQMRAGYQVKGF